MSARKEPSEASGKNVSAARRQSDGVVPVDAKSHDEVDVTQLVHDISEMIDAARKHVAINSKHHARDAPLAGWQPDPHRGARRAPRVLRRPDCRDRRPRPEARYGTGFNEKSLRHMIRFAVAFPGALSANVSETVDAPEFSVEGDSGNR